MNMLRFVAGERTTRNASLNNDVRTIRAVYETDPEIIEAMLPKPLVAANKPEVYLQFAHVAMHMSPTDIVEIGALTCAINCSHEGVPGGYVYVMAMEGESVVTSGRERFGEPKKIAQTSFEKNGNSISASCLRHGIKFFEFEGEIGDALPKPDPFEEYFYCYKGLPSISEPGKFDGDVWLTRLNWKRNYDRVHTLEGKIQFNESAFDPLVDVPIRKMVSLSYVEGTTNTSGQLLETVPGEYILPFWDQRNDTPTNLGVPFDDNSIN